MNDQERIEWLKERQTGIGGSDAAAVLGVHPFMTRLQLYESKVMPVVDEPPTPPQLRGIVLEPIAATLYEERSGRAVRELDQQRHPEHDHMIANVDREILLSDDITSLGTLEIKCPGLKVMSKVKARGLSDYMTIQLMHYLAVRGHEWGSFCLFNAENMDLIWFDLEADSQLIGMLIEQEAEFWADHVVAKVPPAEIDEDLAFEIPEVEGELTIVDGSEWFEAAAELQEAKALAATATELVNMAKERLQDMMTVEGLDAIEVDGQARIYWRPGNPRTLWKGTAQAAAEAEGFDLDKYIKTGKASRSFRPYFLKREEE